MRIRSSDDFKRIYELQQRVGDGRLLIFGAKNDLQNSRLGLSVSRKHGNAVRRVRLKRLIRESFRLSQHNIPTGFDFIVIPRQGVVATIAELQSSIQRLTQKVANRIGESDSP